VRFGRILVPVDGSKSSFQSLEMAATLSKRMASEATVIHVIPESAVAPAEGEPRAIGKEVVSHLEQNAESIISSARSLFAEEGLEVKSDVLRYRDPSNAILEFAEDGAYDLVIMGNGEDDRWELDSVGRVAEKVTKTWKGSVLVVKKTCGLSRISVVIGSEGETGVLELAADLARSFGSQLKVISAPRDGKAAADSALEVQLRKARELGLAPQGEAMPRRDVKQLNRMLSADLTQLAILQKPTPGILGRFLREGGWAYRVLLSCPCSVMLKA